MSRRKEPETEAPGPVVADPVTEETVAEPVLTPDPMPAPPRRRSGLLGRLVGTLLGGAIAASVGFGLSHWNVFGFVPPPAPDLSGKLAELETRLSALPDPTGDLAAQVQALADLETRLAALESRPAPEPVDLSGLQALEDRMTAIESLPAGDGASTAALAARLATLESALQSLPATDISALQADLDAVVARLDAAEAAAATRAAEAEGASRDAALRALSEAVAEGRPFTAELQALADPALDAALGALAETGAPSLADLQTGFPDAAREVLRLSRDISAEDGWSDRLLDFLAAQTEARSLTPREGDSADAILSRAEFALGEGRVADALAELAALDPAIAGPLAPWSDSANLHLAAQSALAAAKGQ